MTEQATQGTQVTQVTQGTKALAFLYARFSSTEQAHGHSLERQIQLAEAYCARHQLELSQKTFADLGISGWKVKSTRDGLQMLLDAVETGAVPKGSHILVEAADRLSRQGYSHVMKLVNKLVHTGCVFVTIENGQQYTAGNVQQLSTALPLMISADLAKQESDRKSERVRAAKAKVRSKGVLEGQVPFWLTVTNGKAELNALAPVARRIVDLLLTGKSAYSIVRMFNEEGLKSPRGKTWEIPVIRQTARNTLLYGTKTYKPTAGTSTAGTASTASTAGTAGTTSTVVQAAGVCPAVCTFEEYQLIQSKGAVKTATEFGPYSTLLRCACCRAPLVIKKQRDGDVYRMCSGRLKKNGCTAKGMYKNLDLILDNELSRLGVLRAKSSELSTQSAQIDHKLGVLSSQIEVLEQVRAQAQADPKMYLMVLQDLLKANNERAALEREQAKLKAESKDAEFLRVCTVSDPKHKNKLLRQLIDVIECSKTGPKSGVLKVMLKNRHRVNFTVHWVKDGYTVLLKADGEKLRDELKKLSSEYP